MAGTKLTDKEILNHVCHLYVEKEKNPPYGLGSSRDLRLYLSRSLSIALGVKPDQITGEEKKDKYNQLHSTIGDDMVAMNTFPLMKE